DKLVTGVQTCALPILRQHVQDELDPRSRSAGRGVLELPSFLYGQAEDRRHRGPRGQVPPEVRGRGRQVTAAGASTLQPRSFGARSEERRVGKGWRSRS